jgi:hypothetical protein
MLAAETARAQQYNPSAGGSVTQSVSPIRAEGDNAARKSPDDQVYGISTTRGARFLLRNGLDYLNYKEYERALKFLREVEARKGELNNAERLMLQKGIETAQRGLRQAAGADSPYALSERSRSHRGFRPASSQTQVAGQTGPPQAAEQNSVLKRTNSTIDNTAHDPDDRGEPIQLASADGVASQPASHNPTSRPARQLEDRSPLTGSGLTQPRRFPDIAELPHASSIPDNSPSDVAPESGQPLTHSPEDRTDRFAVPPAFYQGERTTPESSNSIASSTTVASPLPVITSGLGQERSGAPLSGDTLSPLPIESGAVIASSRTDRAQKLPDISGAAHTETEEAPEQRNAVRSENSETTRQTSSHATETAMKQDEELPPLPRNLGDTTAPGNNPSKPSSSLGTNQPIISVSGREGLDELPPLPRDVSSSAEQPERAVDQARRATDRTGLLSDTGVPAEGLASLPRDSYNEDPRVANAEKAQSTRESGQASAATAAASAPEVIAVVQPGSSSPTVLSSDPVDNRTDESALPPLPNSVGSSAPADGQRSIVQVPSQSGETPAGAGLTEHQEPESTVADPTASAPKPAAATVQPESLHSASATASTPTAGSLSSPLPTAIENPPAVASPSDTLIPSRPNPPSTLQPELKREVEMIVRKQEDELRRRQQLPGQPPPPPRDNTTISDLRAQTQLDISRAPSPAEARPIKAIPVPEDWVPLPPRTWVAQRKYWAAAATCHLPLYFQDPVLERYGHSVEQFLGPVGRYFTYPLDDPTQSTQRNQILQPFFSAGLFALQVAALPYNLIMDPPWEAQYDLGYYRPGDNIPTDTYWLPLHGYGPPLRGSNY